MVKRTGGYRRKTRYKLQRERRARGKLSHRKYLEEYKIGDKITVQPDSIVQKSLPDAKFVGRTGVVSRKTGSCYEVTVNDFGKIKKLIIHPIHMRRC